MKRTILLILLGMLPFKAEAVTLYGCVTNTTGVLRMVPGSTVCKSTERKVHWNQVGPVGPQGPQGYQGPNGISQGYAVSTSAPFNALGGPQAPSIILQTAGVELSGIYYVSASALLDIAPGDGVYCYVTMGGGSGTQGGSNAGYVTGQRVFEQAAMADAVYIPGGENAYLYCYSSANTGQSNVYNAALTAILIDNSTGNISNFKSRKTAPSSYAPAGPKRIYSNPRGGTR